MNDEIKFICAECGKEFEADTDSMVEITLIPDFFEDDEEMPEEGYGEGELKPFELTKQQLKDLEEGKEVVAGGMCICTECQDRMAEEQEAEQ